jgi:hypothetical protein
MRRAAPPIPVSPKLITHFAGATVILTAMLAMFAGGESSQALTEQIEQNERKNIQLAAEADRSLRKKLRAAPKPSAATAVGGVGSVSNGLASSVDPYQTEDPEDLAENESDREELAAPGKAPPRAARGKPPGGKTPRPSAEQVESILEKSSRRSGSSGRD